MLAALVVGTKVSEKTVLKVNSPITSLEGTHGLHFTFLTIHNKLSEQLLGFTVN